MKKILWIGYYFDGEQNNFLHFACENDYQKANNAFQQAYKDEYGEDNELEWDDILGVYRVYNPVSGYPHHIKP